MAAGCAGGAVLVWEACPPGRASLGAPPRHRTPLNPVAALAAGESAVACAHAAAVAALAFDAAGRLLASAAGAELALSAQRGQAATRLKARLPRCHEQMCWSQVPTHSLQQLCALHTVLGCFQDL